MDDSLLLGRRYAAALARCVVQSARWEMIDGDVRPVRVDADGFDGDQYPTLGVAEVHVSGDVNLEILGRHRRRIDDQIVNLADATTVGERKRPVTDVRRWIGDHVVLVEIAEVDEQSGHNGRGIVAFWKDADRVWVHRSVLLSKRRLQR
jgi:hypothetical protein